MGDDLSTGAKIGIGLVILCFLIAIVLALLMVVKNITNSGANQMEGGLNQMMQTTYDDYDQKIVTGTKVTSALKLFQNENMAIVVNSKHLNADSIYLYGMKLQGFTTKTKLDDDDNNAYGSVVTISNDTGSSFKVRDDKVSYGATPESPAQFNLNTRPVDASGYPTFVRSNAKFMSYLIKDSTDTIIGIYFVKQET